MVIKCVKMNTKTHGGSDLLESISNPMTELKQDGAINFETVSLEELIDYIKRGHHNYLREQVSMIQHLSEMTLHENHNGYDYLQEIHDLTCSLLDSIMPHLLKEERIIFPYIEYMEGMINKGKKPKKPPFGNVSSLIIKMHGDHDDASAILTKLRTLSDHYTAPSDATQTWCKLYVKLQELDTDLNAHMHIEDDILFKRALAMEASLTDQ